MTHLIAQSGIRDGVRITSREKFCNLVLVVVEVAAHTPIPILCFDNVCLNIDIYTGICHRTDIAIAGIKAGRVAPWNLHEHIFGCFLVKINLSCNDSKRFKSQCGIKCIDCLPCKIRVTGITESSRSCIGSRSISWIISTDSAEICIIRN